MAKKTLLDIVQQILSDADGDDVNSIVDTVESDQCARVVRDCFDQIVDSNVDIYHHKSTVQLTATDAATPNVMERPAGLWAIEWLQYNKKATAAGDQRYENVSFVDPDRFMVITGNRTASDTDIQEVVLDSGHSILVKNDQSPTYYTFIEGYDDIIFDSFDSALETNLQASKSLAYGIIKPSLTLSDTAEPNLPEHLIVLLYREARAMYFDLYKDGVSREVDRTRRRAEVRAQRQRRMVKNSDNNNGPNYGRK